MRLKDRVVIVGGAGGGVGKVVCDVVLKEGAFVVALDRDAASLESVAADAEADRVLRIGADMSDFDAAERVAAEAIQTFGRVDVLVNLAGVFAVKDFCDTMASDWQDAYSANLMTAVAMCRAIAPSMLEQRSGSIINFASAAGEYGSIRPAAPYAAAKGAVIALTKTLARELSPHGVRVNAISPGPIETQMFSVGGTASTSSGASRTLLGRMGHPEDMAAGVVYLAASDAAFVTGEVLRINGGALL